MDVSTELLVHGVGIIATAATCWTTLRMELRRQGERHDEHVKRHEEHVATDKENHRDVESRMRDLERIVARVATRLKMDDDTGVMRIGHRNNHE